MWIGLDVWDVGGNPLYILEARLTPQHSLSMDSSACLTTMPTGN